MFNFISVGRGGLDDYLQFFLLVSLTNYTCQVRLAYCAFVNYALLANTRINFSPLTCHSKFRRWDEVRSTSINQERPFLHKGNIIPHKWVREHKNIINDPRIRYKTLPRADEISLSSLCWKIHS